MMLSSVKTRARKLPNRCGLHDNIHRHFPLENSGFDAATMKIIEQVSPFTLTGAERIFALKNAGCVTPRRIPTQQAHAYVT